MQWTRVREHNRDRRGGEKGGGNGKGRWFNGRDWPDMVVDLKVQYSGEKLCFVRGILEL